MILSGDAIRERLNDGEIFRKDTCDEKYIEEASYALRLAPDGMMLGGNRVPFAFRVWRAYGYIVYTLKANGTRAGAEKNELKPWRKKEWCIPKVSAEFVACMEDVLDLYAEPYDSKRPVVCFDETSKQLVSEKRSPIPAKAGRQERFDYEYQRNGTRNLFMTCEPLAGWRHVAVTERRTTEDFAHQMRWLADAAYPKRRRSGWCWIT